MRGTDHLSFEMLNREVARERADRYMGPEHLVHPRDRRVDEVERDVVQRHVEGLPPGSLVLDVPCGNGRLTHWACQRADLRVLAVDFSRNMLLAMERPGLEGILGARVQGSVFHLPFPDGCAGLVLNIRLLHHLPGHGERVAMLREIARVARGPVITSYWSTHSLRHLRKWLRRRPIKLYPIAPSEMRAACREAGLEIEKVWPVRRWREKQCLVVCRSRAWSG